MSNHRNDPRTRCLVIKDNRLLCMIREFSADNRTLLMPGGGIDAGESSLTAVKRELVEELGLVTSVDPTYFYTHTQRRDIFPDERSYFKGVDFITDIHDFYVYKVKPFDKIEVQQEEWEKWHAYGFIQFHDIKNYAAKHKAKMGIGIEAAIKAIEGRQDLFK